jgi:hypothetical protein
LSYSHKPNLLLIKTPYYEKTLLFLAFALFATAFLKAQTDVNLGDFEDGVTNDWMLYGESLRDY